MTGRSYNYDMRRWVTLVVCALASLCCGFSYAWSVLVRPWMEMFGWSSSDLALAFTLQIAVAASCTLLAGKALQYVRPPTLLLIGGAILGLGVLLLGFATSLGMLYAAAVIAGLGGVIYPGATMTNLMRFFPERRGMASGVLTGGFGLGAVIWGPITVLLMDELGLQWTLRILGVLFFAIVAVCSRLVTIAPPDYAPRGWTRPSPQVVEDGAAGGKDWRQMTTTLGFWMLAAVFVIGLTSGLMLTSQASPIAQQKLGISAEAAGVFVSYLALGMTVGKVGWGMLSDRFGRYLVIITMLALATLASVLLWQTSTYAPVVLGIFVVGTCYGGFLSLIGPVTLDAFGGRHFSINFGVMFLTVAVASYVGPRLAAGVAQANAGVYSQAFLIAALLSLAGLGLAAGYVRLARRRAVAASQAG